MGEKGWMVRVGMWPFFCALQLFFFAIFALHLVRVKSTSHMPMNVLRPMVL